MILFPNAINNICRGAIERIRFIYICPITRFVISMPLHWANDSTIFKKHIIKWNKISLSIQIRKISLGTMRKVSYNCAFMRHLKNGWNMGHRSTIISYPVWYLLLKVSSVVDLIISSFCCQLSLLELKWLNWVFFNIDLFYLYMLTALSCIGGFLFGYDTGVISGALVLLKDEFNLTDTGTYIIAYYHRCCPNQREISLQLIFKLFQSLLKWFSFIP